MKNKFALTLTLAFGLASWYFLSSSTDGVVGHYFSAGAALSGLDRTGGPLSGGSTCAACHGGGAGTTTIAFTLKNSSNVAVTSYLPGVSYTAEFQVTSSSIIKGFQAVALRAGNLQGGNFTLALTPQSQISTLGGRQYPEHQGGTNSSGLFRFTWVAPVAGSGSVTFYAAGNGVNGLGSTSGDVPSLPINAVITEGISTSFSYPVTEVCNNDANQTATISGTSGGTFSASPAGLIVNSSTGQITTVGSSPGLYTITYTFAGGTTTKQMRIRPVFNINNTASICQGQSIFLAGANQTTAGTYTSNLQTAAGCDSIVVTTLTIKQPSSSTLALTTCAGDTVFVGGQAVSTAGLSTILIPNAAGCDSTISVTLTLNPVQNTTNSLTICQGESVLFGGVLRTTSGVYTSTSQSANGCDSNSVLNLTVTPINLGLTNTSPTLTSQASGAAYQWLDCGNNFAEIVGATSQSFTPQANGSYAVRVTQQNCSDTSACETVANVGLEEKIFGEIKLYPNPSDGVLGLIFSQSVDAKLTLRDMNGKVLFVDDINGSSTYSSALSIESGVYFVEINGNDTKTQVIWIVK